MRYQHPSLDYKLQAVQSLDKNHDSSRKKEKNKRISNHLITIKYTIVGYRKQMT